MNQENKQPLCLHKDFVVVVDIEATCWEDKITPEGQQNEIIEMGVCLVNLETGELSQKRSILVKPTRSKVSEFCTKLTTLTQEQVNVGISFEDACAVLETDYLTQERVWVSWGNYDRKMFEQQCASFFVRYPFSPQHVNLKKYFGRYFVKQKYKQVGMAQALELVQLPLEGTHHRGDDDAWNIGRLLQYTLQHHSSKFLFK